MFSFLRRDRKTESQAQQPDEQRALDDPILWEIFGAVPTGSGISVGPGNALRVPAVANAVGLIAETCGSLPCKIYQRQGGTKDTDPDHPAYELVHETANPWTSAFQFRSDLTRDAMLHGAGYGLAIRSSDRPVELHRLEPTAVSVDRDPATGEPFYRVSEATGGSRIFGYRDVIHITPFAGVAPIQLAREAIALALVLEQHGSSYFSRGGRPDGILHTDSKLGAEAVKRVAAAWKAVFGGGKSGGTTILDDGIKYQPITFSSVDSQFEQMRRFQILEIARAFRISPIFLMEYGRATWSNSEEMGRMFLRYSLLPWLRTWSAAYKRVLIGQDQHRSHSVEFITDGLLEADTSKRATAYSQFRAAGVYTSNELRRLENLPPHEDGDVLASPHTTPGTPSTSTGGTDE